MLKKRLSICRDFCNGSNKRTFNGLEFNLRCGFGGNFQATQRTQIPKCWIKNTQIRKFYNYFHSCFRLLGFPDRFAQEFVYKPDGSRIPSLTPSLRPYFTCWANEMIPKAHQCREYQNYCVIEQRSWDTWIRIYHSVWPSFDSLLKTVLIKTWWFPICEFWFSEIYDTFLRVRCQTVVLIFGNV